MTPVEVATSGVAKITCRRQRTATPETGSGYLVAPGIVLTAGHVVAYGATDVELSVAFLGDTGMQYRATVLASGHLDEPDLALLKIAGGGPTPAYRVRFGEIDRGSVAQIPGCVAVGFPMWKRSDQSAQLEGTIATAANLSVTTTGPLELRTDSTPRDRSTPNKSAWAGMSGAVVFARGPDSPVAIGVVTTHQLTEGNSTVTVTPLTSLPNEKIWLQHLDIVGRVRFPISPPITYGADLEHVERPVPTFTDRENDVSKIDELLGYATTAAGTVINIYGMGGVGKSELAKHLAHRQKLRFSRLLYLDLGEDEARKSRDEVVATLLEQLVGTSEEKAPRNAREGVRLARKRLGSVPTLVVLDNADGADQFADLAPPASSAVLVTSRAQLADEPVEWFHHLEPLDTEHGLALFTTLIGTQRVDLDQEAAGRIVTYVGGLPLGVRVAASTAVSSLWRDRPLSVLAAEYAASGDVLYQRIFRVFDVSYDGLEPATAAFFGRIGQLPGIDFGLPLAAHVTRTEPPDAKAMLEELVRRELTMVEGAEPRYRLHPLVRRFARARSQEAEAAVVTLAVGWHADRVASLMSAEGAHEQPPQDALDWIAVEADNLRATWRAGEAIRAWDELARLMDNVYGLLAYRGRWSDMVEAQKIGVTATRATGNRRALVGRLIHLAEAMRITGTVAETESFYEEAVAITRDLADPGVEGWVLTHHGDMLCDLGEPLRAIEDHYERARTIYDRLGDAGAINWLTAHVTDARMQANQLHEAINEAERELAGARERGDQAGVIWCQEHLALALTAARRFPAARAALAEAIDYHEKRDNRIGLATALLHTARVDIADDRAERALEQLVRAREQVAAVDADHPLLEDIEAELAALEASPE